MATVNIMDFLIKLNINLSNSIDSFQRIDKSKVNNINSLYDIIQQNTKKLYRYLEYMKQLELLHFNNQCNEKQFIMAFDIDNDLYDKNFKKKFKDNMEINVNVHKLKKKIASNSKKPMLETCDINILDSCDIGPNRLNIPIIKDLKNIPPMFYWYEGDSSYKKGIYTCISPGFYSRVPFPNVISTINQNYKINSIPCKYDTKEACNSHKKRISEVHNSEIRKCSYVHRKEKFAKIGAVYRCNKESFGNHATLTNDMNYISISDIKRILLYSLSDSLLSVLWYQNKFKDGDLILNNIDIF